MNAKLETTEKPRHQGVMERVLNHPFFSGLSREEMAIVAKSIEPGAAQEAVFEPNEVILREGEPANRLYLIESGSVLLEVHEPADGTFPIQKLEAGDFLGFSWLFPPFTWHLQARALETTKAVVLDGAHLLVTAEQNKVFGYDLMKRIGQVAIRRLQAARKEYVKVSQQLQAARQALEAKQTSKSHPESAAAEFRSH